MFKQLVYRYLQLCIFALLALATEAQAKVMRSTPEIKLGVRAINELICSEMKERNVSGKFLLKKISFKYVYSNDVSQAFIQFENDRITHVGYFPASFLPGYKDSFPEKIVVSGDTYKSIEDLLRSVLILESVDFEEIQLMRIRWSIFAENYSSTGTLRLNPDDEVTYFNSGLQGKSGSVEDRED